MRTVNSNEALAYYVLDDAPTADQLTLIRASSKSTTTDKHIVKLQPDLSASAIAAAFSGLTPITRAEARAMIVTQEWRGSPDA